MLSGLTVLGRVGRCAAIEASAREVGEREREAEEGLVEREVEDAEQGADVAERAPEEQEDPRAETLAWAKGSPRPRPAMLFFVRGAGADAGAVADSLALAADSEGSAARTVEGRPKPSPMGRFLVEVGGELVEVEVAKEGERSGIEA